MDGGVPEIAEGGSSWWTTTALWTFVLFGSFLLNATLLLAFVRRPGLRTISNRFVMNLTASNLLTCAILTPLLMMDAPPSSPSLSLCSLSEGATALVTASSILSVLLIAIDQYFAVVDPLRYRTRIDKLKCAALIIAIWMVSILFGLFAIFNPHPHSLWLSCGTRRTDTGDRSFSVNSTLDLTIDSRFLIGRNGTEDYDMEGELKLTEQKGSSTFEEDVEFAENSTSFIGRTYLESFDEAINDTATRGAFYVTYSLVYTAMFSLFVYLLPFVGVCWIYISIYSAAHKNSERARRTGSGPMLSSPSFCEEYCVVRQEYSTDDFRRIPKISSLSSIDESIETSPSHMTRRRSELMLSSAIEEEPAGVVFTVGSQKVDVTPQKVLVEEAKDTYKVPVSALKTEFLRNREEGRLIDELVRSRFRDRPDDRRKSSHDMMCEATLRSGLDDVQVAGDLSEESSDEDEEEMLTFSKNRRLQDIEVSKCQNSIEDPSNCSLLIEDHEAAPGEPVSDDPCIVDVQETCIDVTSVEKVEAAERKDPHHETLASKLLSRVENSRRILPNGTLSRAAVESHNTRSKLQNGKMNGRYLNGHHQHRSEAIFETADDAFPKGASGITFLEVEPCSSLLTSSASAPTVTITPPNKTCGLHRVSSIKSTSSYINSLKYRISNASLFKYREETRAARISALVIVMGLICWTPFIVILNLRNFPYYNDDALPHAYDVMALSFLILTAYISPLLFGYRSRRVKRELRKIFCFKKELSYKNNRSLMAKKVLKRRHSGNLSQLEMDPKYNILNCVYGRQRWPKEKVQFMQVPETALAVETCRSSFSSGASTQISTTSTEE